MDRNKDGEPDNAVEETIDEMMVDPDSPKNGKTSPPPQTIDAEPTGGEKR